MREVIEFPKRKGSTHTHTSTHTHMHASFTTGPGRLGAHGSPLDFFDDERSGY